MYVHPPQYQPWLTWQTAGFGALYAAGSLTTLRFGMRASVAMSVLAALATMGGYIAFQRYRSVDASHDEAAAPAASAVRPPYTSWQEPWTRLAESHGIDGGGTFGRLDHKRFGKPLGGQAPVLPQYTAADLVQADRHRHTRKLDQAANTLIEDRQLLGGLDIERAMKMRALAQASRRI